MPRRMSGPIGVWDPSPAAAARLAEVAPGVAMLDGAAAVIEACDCLYVAAPPKAHLPLAEAALGAGRAVFLEKPLAVDLAEARDFVAKAEALGARAAVNFPMASSPGVAQLVRLAGGRRGRRCREPRHRGRLRHLAARLAAGCGKLAGPPGGGRLHPGGAVAHFLFLTRRQLGPLVLQEATVTYPGGDAAETAITARLTAGGVPVTLAGGVGTTPKDDHNTWTLRGPAGAIRLHDWSVAERLDADGGWQPAPDAMPNARLRPEVLRRQLASVAAMTRGKTHPLATLREALEVQEVVEAILASAA